MAASDMVKVHDRIQNTGNTASESEPKYNKEVRQGQNFAERRKKTVSWRNLNQKRKFERSEGNAVQQTSKDGYNRNPQKKKFSPYLKAQKEYEKLQEEDKKRREEIQRQREEKQKRFEEYKKTKRERERKYSRRTKTGQPLMKDRMELLLKEIVKQVGYKEQQ